MSAPANVVLDALLEARGNVAELEEPHPQTLDLPWTLTSGSHNSALDLYLTVDTPSITIGGKQEVARGALLPQLKRLVTRIRHPERSVKH